MTRLLTRATPFLPFSHTLVASVVGIASCGNILHAIQHNVILTRTSCTLAQCFHDELNKELFFFFYTCRINSRRRETELIRNGGYTRAVQAWRKRERERRAITSDTRKIPGFYSVHYKKLNPAGLTILSICCGGRLKKKEKKTMNLPASASVPYAMPSFNFFSSDGFDRRTDELYKANLFRTRWVTTSVPISRRPGPPYIVPRNTLKGLCRS